MRCEPRERAGGQAADPPAASRRVLAHEVLREQRRCRPVRSRSGGSASGDDVEPVEEVLRGTGRALTVGLEVAVGRGDQPRTSTRTGLRAADALELALLQHAQQLRLQLERQLADLVEEQRAAVGQLELALLRADRRR